MQICDFYYFQLWAQWLWVSDFWWKLEVSTTARCDLHLLQASSLPFHGEVSSTCWHAPCTHWTAYVLVLLTSLQHRLGELSYDCGWPVCRLACQSSSRCRLLPCIDVSPTLFGSSFPTADWNDCWLTDCFLVSSCHVNAVSVVFYGYYQCYILLFVVLLCIL